MQWHCGWNNPKEGSLGQLDANGVEVMWNPQNSIYIFVVVMIGSIGVYLRLAEG